MFIDRFRVNPDGIYSDGGAACEIFSNEAFLEVESLGELKDVAAGQTAEHEEQWELIAAAEEPEQGDEEALKKLAEKYR